MKKLQQNGFTIVELLVVIVVIGILAAITIVSYNGITTKAKTASVTSYLNSFSKKYQEQVVLNNGNLTSTQFDNLNTLIPTQEDISYNFFKLTMSSGTIITAFCVNNASSNGLQSYFVNSTDRLTPTKGVCTGAASGAYTLQ
jgi:prepilin-type N-terminal cleavage/methylation domain-containing protein